MMTIAVLIVFALAALFMLALGLLLLPSGPSFG